eukprot:RCo007915
MHRGSRTSLSQPSVEASVSLSLSPVLDPSAPLPLPPAESVTVSGRRTWRPRPSHYQKELTTGDAWFSLAGPTAGGLPPAVGQSRDHRHSVVDWEPLLVEFMGQRGRRRATALTLHLPGIATLQSPPEQSCSWDSRGSEQSFGAPGDSLKRSGISPLCQKLNEQYSEVTTLCRSPVHAEGRSPLMLPQPSPEMPPEDAGAKEDRRRAFEDDAAALLARLSSDLQGDPSRRRPGSPKHAHHSRAHPMFPTVTTHPTTQKGKRAPKKPSWSCTTMTEHENKVLRGMAHSHREDIAEKIRRLRQDPKLRREFEEYVEQVQAMRWKRLVEQSTHRFLSRNRVEAAQVPQRGSSEHREALASRARSREHRQEEVLQRRYSLEVQQHESMLEELDQREAKRAAAAQ